MKIEHFAFNVEAPNEMASWYEEHLQMRIVRQQSQAPYTHFLADSGGSVMIEIYNNPADDVPAYRQLHPLQLHLAFVSQSPERDKARLLQAGASLVEEVRTDDGSHLVMLKDPWGFSLQLCKRGKPMLG